MPATPVVAPNVYPPPVPTVNGQAITVDAFLQDPLRVWKVISDLTLQRFVADMIYAPGGTATGGAVIFDQVLTNNLYMDRDVQAIAPGSEFPILTDDQEVPLVARTVKWGGAAVITYEERDRDRRDVLRRELTKLRNTIVRKVDSVAVATLRAAPIQTVNASASWAGGSASSGHIFEDIMTGLTVIDKLDMGYRLDTALISPTTELSLITNGNLRDAIWKSRGAVASPLASARLEGLLGLTYYVTNRVSDNEVILLPSQQAGSISDEKPLYTRVVDQPERERILVMGARLTVPYVTDPLSVVRITGMQ